MIASNPEPQPTSQIGYGDYLRFRNLVLERSGLYFPEKKIGDLEAGLHKALAESCLTPVNTHYNLDHYYSLLCDKSNPTGQAEMERLINALTIGETYFFRNEAQFQALATEVLPALIAHKRTAAAAIGPDIKPQLRIWSAGCSTGEEAYSLAILLKELLPDIANWYIFILATDINQDSLLRARQALYSTWSFREARAKTLCPLYFKQAPTTKQYQLRDDIRQMVTFVPLNLIEDDYPAIHNNTINMDLILCRNVTIYFTETGTRQVIKQFYESLVINGWLVVGHSEPSLVVYRAFQACSFPNTILYRKTGQATLWPDNWVGLGQPKDCQQPVSTLLNPASQTPPPQPNISTPETKSFLATDSEDDTTKTNIFSTQSSLPSSSNIEMTLTNSSTQSGTVLPLPEVDLYELARVLLKEGRLEEAIDQLHRKLAATPDFAPAHSLLGRAYASQGNWLEARRWCESALNLDNLLAEAHYVLALTHDQAGEIQLAIDALKRAIYLEREMPLFHFNLAVLYKKADQVEEAQRSCRNVIRILEKRPSTEIVPETGGATAQYLLKATQRILNEL